MEDTAKNNDASGSRPTTQQVYQDISVAPHRAPVKLITSDEADTAACSGSVGENGETQRPISDDFIAHIKQEIGSEPCGMSDIGCTVKAEQCTAPVKEEIDHFEAAVSEIPVYDRKQEAEQTFSIPSQSEVFENTKEQCLELDIKDPELCKWELTPDQKHIANTTENEIEISQRTEVDACDGVCNSSPDYKCAVCDYTTKYRHSIVLHLKTKHDPNAEVYKCAECDYATQMKYRLVLHVKTKHNPNAKVHKCAKCDYTSKYKQNLLAHVKTKHNPHADVYKCAECDYTCKWKNCLLLHVKTKHDLDADLYKCAKCDYITKRRDVLQLHVKIKHDPNADVYNCAECDHTSKYKYNLLAHVNSKHRPRTSVYKCAECDFACRWKHGLLVHMKIKHAA